MTRLVFPDDGSRLAFRLDPAGRLQTADGLTAIVTTDAAGTTLADILTYPGGASVTSLTVAADSMLPLWQGPDDGTDTLYVSVNGGTPTATYARVDDRLDALAAMSPTSKTIVIPSPAAATWVIWRAAYPCTVSAVRGYLVGGTGAQINATNAGSDLLPSALTLSTTDTWVSAPSLQNASLAVGSSLAVRVVSASGSPTALTVQVELVSA